MSEYGRANYDFSEESCRHGKHPNTCVDCISIEKTMVDSPATYATYNTCRHGVSVSRCKECQVERNADMIKDDEYAVTKERIELNLRPEITTNIACFHGVVGICEQCQQIEDWKKATMLPEKRQYNRETDIKQHIIGLLKVVINMIEEL